MSVRGRLMMGFGLLLALLLVVSVVAVVSIRSINQRVNSLADVQVPLSETSYEMEIHAVSAVSEAFAYLHRPNETFRSQYALSVDAFEDRTAAFQRQARNEEEDRIGESIVAQFQVLTSAASELFALTDEEAVDVAALREQIRETSQFVVQQIEQRAADSSPAEENASGSDAGLAQIQVNAELEGILSATEEYLLYESEGALTRLQQRTTATRREIDRLRTISTDPAVQQFATALSLQVDEIESLGNRLVDVADAQDQQTEALVAADREINRIIDQELQPIVNASDAVVRAQASTGQATSIALWTILILGVVSLIFGAIATFIILRSITEPLSKLKAMAQELGEGKLRVRSQLKGQDELSMVGRAMDAAIDNLAQVVRSLANDAVHLATSANELASSAEEISRTTTSHQDQVNRTSSAIEEITSATKHVAHNAETAAKAAIASTEYAQQGASRANNMAGRINHTDHVMQRLHSRSAEIGTIVNLIREVAAQTNILALNAAIEAAGAGEAGSRFDVVAEEIRNLSVRTSRATEEIVELIQVVQSDVETAATAMTESASIAQETGSALSDIVESTVSVRDMLQHISSATLQQTQSSQEISSALNSMVMSSEQTSQATKETAQISIELSGLADRLSQATRQFEV